MRTRQWYKDCCIKTLANGQHMPLYIKITISIDTQVILLLLLCLLYPILPVSLDYPFLIAPSGFFNV